MNRSTVARCLHAVADWLEAVAWWFKVKAEDFGEGNEVLR